MDVRNVCDAISCVQILLCSDVCLDATFRFIKVTKVCYFYDVLCGELSLYSQDTSSHIFCLKSFTWSSDWVCSLCVHSSHCGILVQMYNYNSSYCLDSNGVCCYWNAHVLFVFITPSTQPWYPHYVLTLALLSNAGWSDVCSKVYSV